VITTLKRISFREPKQDHLGPDDQSFHEKAGRCQEQNVLKLDRVSASSGIDQREALSC
jgi:hypothetical protein